MKKEKLHRPIRIPVLYFIYEDEVYSGQYVLSSLLERGIKRDALVWDTEAEHWRQADEVEELKDYFEKIKNLGSTPLARQVQN